MILISFLIIIIYIIYIIFNYGIPHSLSLTYYLINNKWIFRIVLAGSSILILPIILSMDYSYFSFLGISGVLFVSFSPDFKSDELVDKVHTISAIISSIFSWMWIGFTYSSLLLCWIPFLVYLIILIIRYKSIKNFLNFSNIKFYIELLTILMIYIILFIK